MQSYHSVFNLLISAFCLYRFYRFISAAVEIIKITGMLVDGCFHHTVCRLQSSLTTEAAVGLVLVVDLQSLSL